MDKKTNGKVRELEAVAAEAEAVIAKVKAEAVAMATAALPELISAADRFEALYWVAELRRLETSIEARQERIKRLEAERAASMAEAREIEASLQRARERAAEAEARRRATYQIGDGDSWDGRTGQIHRNKTGNS
jgi:hypothetical protein